MLDMYGVYLHRKFYLSKAIRSWDRSTSENPVEHMNWLIDSGYSSQRWYYKKNQVNHSGAFLQDPTGNHRKWYDKFRSGILLPWNRPEWSGSGRFRTVRLDLGTWTLIWMQWRRLEQKSFLSMNNLLTTEVFRLDRMTYIITCLSDFSSIDLRRNIDVLAMNSIVNFFTNLISFSLY